jgi:hypothetical protein
LRLVIATHSLKNAKPLKLAAERNPAIRLFSMKRHAIHLHYYLSGADRTMLKEFLTMRTSLEVINRSAILLHIPDDHGNAVKIILGGADGPLVTIDPAGHIHVSPSVGPGDPEVRKAVSGILQGIQEIARLANEAKAATVGMR